MKSGQLRHRITIERVTEGRGTSGGVTETWSEFTTVWASVEPISGREYFAAQQVNAQVSHRVKVRYRAGITPKMRVVFGSRIFHIEAALNIGERNVDLQLMCVELV